MKKKLFNVLLFTAGAAVGSLVTWKVVKTKYERIAQEEINSVKETWARMMREESETYAASEDDEQDDEEDDPDDAEDDDFDAVEYDQRTVTAYHEIANMYKQSGNKAETEGEGEGDQDEEEDVPYINGPVLILPEDFGDGDYDHELYCLTYYNDGVLADDWFKKYDVDETIGEDSVNHFGEYVNGVIHVRNERLNADYEVVRDPRNYADIIHNDPLMSAYEG